MKNKCDLDYDNYAELLKAIGHPIRLKIVAGILCNECNVNGIVDQLNIPQSTVSQHLGVLRSRGIITAHKEGVSTCYKVSNDFVLNIINMMNKG